MAYSAGFHPHPEDQLRRRGADRGGFGGRVPRDRAGPPLRAGAVRAALDAVLPDGLDILRAVDAADCRPARWPSRSRPRLAAGAGRRRPRLAGRGPALLALTEALVERLTKDGVRRSTPGAPWCPPGVAAPRSTRATVRYCGWSRRQVAPTVAGRCASTRCGPVAGSSRRRASTAGPREWRCRDRCRLTPRAIRLRRPAGHRRPVRARRCSRRAAVGRRFRPAGARPGHPAGAGTGRRGWCRRHRATNEVALRRQPTQPGCRSAGIGKRCSQARAALRHRPQAPAGRAAARPGGRRRETTRLRGPLAGGPPCTASCAAGPVKPRPSRRRTRPRLAETGAHRAHARPPNRPTASRPTLSRRPPDAARARRPPGQRAAPEPQGRAKKAAPTAATEARRRRRRPQPQRRPAEPPTARPAARTATSRCRPAARRRGSRRQRRPPRRRRRSGPGAPSRRGRRQPATERRAKPRRPTGSRQRPPTGRSRRRSAEQAAPPAEQRRASRCRGARRAEHVEARRPRGDRRATDAETAALARRRTGRASSRDRGTAAGRTPGRAQPPRTPTADEADRGRRRASPSRRPASSGDGGTPSRPGDGPRRRRRRGRRGRGEGAAPNADARTRPTRTRPDHAEEVAEAALSASARRRRRRRRSSRGRR